MFKKNYDHVPKDTYFAMYKESTRGNPNYFLTYGNEKSAAQIQDHFRPNGAHRWHNYMKTPNEIRLEEAAVLHYIYAKFSDLTSRHDRCGCKPTREYVKRCFMLEFDRAGIPAASKSLDSSDACVTVLCIKLATWWPWDELSSSKVVGERDAAKTVETDAIPALQKLQKKKGRELQKK